MKVQITIEVSDEERIGIGAVVNSTFAPASRSDVRQWVTDVVEASLSPISTAVEAQRESLVATLTLEP